MSEDRKVIACVSAVAAAVSVIGAGLSAEFDLYKLMLALALVALGCITILINTVSYKP